MYFISGLFNFLFVIVRLSSLKICIVSLYNAQYIHTVHTVHSMPHAVLWVWWLVTVHCLSHLQGHSVFRPECIRCPVLPVMLLMTHCCYNTLSISLWHPLRPTMYLFVCVFCLLCASKSRGSSLTLEWAGNLSYENKDWKGCFYKEPNTRVCGNSKASARGILDHKATTMHSIISKAETEEAFPTQDQTTLPCWLECRAAQLSYAMLLHHSSVRGLAIWLVKLHNKTTVTKDQNVET